MVPAAEFFISTVAKAVAKAMADQGMSQDKQAALHGFRFTKGEGGKPVPYSPSKETLMQLKASPLAGVWATGPYLHNGSVPTIYELLSPRPSGGRSSGPAGARLTATGLGLSAKRHRDCSGLIPRCGGTAIWGMTSPRPA